MSAKISDLAKSLLNYSGDVGRLRDGITSEYVFPHVEETRSILHLEELVLESNADKSDEVRAHPFSLLQG